MSSPNGFTKLLEAFTRPLVVAIVLLTVNGFLLYRYLERENEGGSIDSGPLTVTEERTVESTVFVTSPETNTESEPGDAEEDGQEVSTLEEGLRDCREEGTQAKERCFAEAVSQAASAAKYIGGSTYLNAKGPGRHNRVLYFEDPALKLCEFERQDLPINTDSLTVIVAGEGSFGAEAEQDCIPSR